MITNLKRLFKKLKIDDFGLKKVISSHITAYCTAKISSLSIYCSQSQDASVELREEVGKWHCDVHHPKTISFPAKIFVTRLI